jgi:hypothetical protein
MNLLDRAIKLAAEQDEPLEMNFVRKHAQQQAEELGVGLRDAATRVFSNASGVFWREGSLGTACCSVGAGAPHSGVACRCTRVGACQAARLPARG